MVDAGTEPSTVLTIFRGACFAVAAVAGLTGTVMLVAPASTDAYFSWPIGPRPLAALVGAFYVASAVTFAVLGAYGDWPAARGVCFGILAFTLPTVAATVRHRDLFDWGRWQAVAWLGLFVGSPVAFSSQLFLQRGRVSRPGGRLSVSTRRALGVLGAAYTILAIGLLLVPARLQTWSPFALPGLSGRFLGSWCAFLAVLALFALRRDQPHEAAFPLLALLVWPLAALVAAVRSFHDLQSPLRRAVYLVLVLSLGALAAVAMAAERRLPRRLADRGG